MTPLLKSLSTHMLFHVGLSFVFAFAHFSLHPTIWIWNSYPTHTYLGSFNDKSIPSSPTKLLWTLQMKKISSIWMVWVHQLYSFQGIRYFRSYSVLSLLIWSFLNIKFNSYSFVAYKVVKLVLEHCGYSKQLLKKWLKPSWRTKRKEYIEENNF